MFAAGMLAAAAVVLDVWLDGRSRAAASTSADASKDWTAEAVEAAMTGASNRVEAVKRLRQKDQGLSLLDAKRLVDRHADF